MSKIKVMIAEDHDQIRNWIVSDLIKFSNEIEIIGDAKNGKILIDLVKKDLPDIVLLDMSMPVMNGKDVLKIFKAGFPTIKTIIYSGGQTELFVSEAILDGAAAYIDKDKGMVGEIVEAILTVHKENYYFNEHISRRILLSLLDPNKKRAYFLNDIRFSENELEIIRLSCLNFKTKEIADALNISTNTVKYHKKEIYYKTNSNTIVDLVIYAIKQGIIKLDD